MRRKAVALDAVIRNLHVIFIKSRTPTHTGVNFLSIEARTARRMNSPMIMSVASN